MILCFAISLAGAIVFISGRISLKRAEKILSEMTEETNKISEETNKEDNFIGGSIDASEENGTDQEDDTFLNNDRDIKNSNRIDDISIPEKSIDWEKLKIQNPDIYAWITVSDTLVDYPVLQSPTDDSFYLNHNIDGSYGSPGCIYTEATYNSKDFDDRNTVLYGHNMDDRTMFGTLHYFDDPDFALTDKYIYIYTENDIFVYLIFGAYEYSNKHLMWSYDYSDDAVFKGYLDEIFSIEDEYGGVNNIRDDIELDVDDKIITLSTCSTGRSDDRRYLVQGVLLEKISNTGQ